jgi:hypothetical protein
MALEVRSRQPLPGGERALRDSGAVTAQIELEGDRYADDAQRAAFIERLVARLSARPGIAAVAATTALPLLGAEELAVEVEGTSPLPGNRRPSVHAIGITPAYFEAFELPILRGRGPRPADGSPGHASVVVSQRFVDLHFGAGDPIGRRIRLAPAGQGEPSWTEWLTVAGVAPTVRQRPTPAAVPVVYRPYRTMASPALALVLRSRDSAEALDALRADVAALDPRQPVFRTGPIDRVLDDARWMGRVSSGLARSITAVALLLALVGLYSVTAYGVQLRAREVAIRLSLGASRSHVLLGVLRRALRHLLPGVVAGVVLILLWDRLLAPGAQAGVRVSDWQVVASAVAFLVLLAAGASLLPAWRASRADPLEALRPRA